MLLFRTQVLCGGKVIRRKEPLAIFRSFVSPTSGSETEKKYLDWIRGGEDCHISKAVNLRFLPELGFDLVATSNIPTNTTVASIPKVAWSPYSADHATQVIEKEHPLLFQSILATTNQVLPSQSRETSNLIRSCCLSLQLLRHVQSNQSLYASFLSSITYPWNNQAYPHPLLMNKSDTIEPFLGSTKLMMDITKRQSFYSLFISKLLQNGDTLAYLIEHQFLAHAENSPDPVTQYLWAIGVVLSRGLSSPNSPLSLVPYLDFANHTNPIATNCLHRFDATKQAFELVTSRDIKAQESLRISYGEARSTESFMVLYGFAGLDIHIPTLGDNKNDDTAGQVSLPINPNDLFTLSIPVQIVPGKSHLPTDTITADDFFQIFQSVPPLILGDITEDIVLLYEHIQVNLAKANAANLASVPTSSVTAQTKQVCDITFPIHLLTGPASMTTWTKAGANFTLPPSMTSAEQYREQCVAVIVDVLLRTRKVAAIVAGEGDSLSSLNVTISDVQSLQKDIVARMHILLPEQVQVAYNLTEAASTAEMLQILRTIITDTDSNSNSKSSGLLYWRKHCAQYMRQQLVVLQIMEEECQRLLQNMQESLLFNKK